MIKISPTIIDLLKHHAGKHNQKNHGRRTARREAYHEAYREARTSGKGHAEARSHAKGHASGVAVAAPVAVHTPAPIAERPFQPRQFKNARDADKQLTAASSVHESDLDYFTQAAFQNYQHEGYKTINGGLRSGDKKQLRDHKDEIQRMDRVFDRSRTSEDLEVFRGMVVHPGSAAEKLLESWAPGSTHKEQGYMSTTVDKGRVDKFIKSVGGKGKGGKQVDIRVRVPAGSKAIYMNAAVSQRGITNYREERELLLGRGSNYRIISQREENGRIVVDMEIVP